MRYIIFLLLLLGSCSNPKFNCDYKVITTTNAVENGDTIYTLNPVSYGFYIDTALIKFTSYEKAASGIATMASNGSEISSDITGVWDASQGMCVIENISQQFLTIVVCDPATKSWAYRLAETAKGLKDVIVPLMFEPWKITEENPSYKTGTWTVFRKLDTEE